MENVLIPYILSNKKVNEVIKSTLQECGLKKRYFRNWSIYSPLIAKSKNSSQCLQKPYPDIHYEFSLHSHIFVLKPAFFYLFKMNHLNAEQILKIILLLEPGKWIIGTWNESRTADVLPRADIGAL